MLHICNGMAWHGYRLSNEYKSIIRFKDPIFPAYFGANTEQSGSKNAGDNGTTEMHLDAFTEENADFPIV